MKLVIEPMDLDDIPQVLEVDRESYTLPWPASAYRREVLHNRNAHYLVLRESASGEEEVRPAPDTRLRAGLPFFHWPLRSSDGRAVGRGKIVGYAGMWIMVDEAHITTIAVRQSYRGKGLGELLLLSMIEEAAAAGAERLTLEVRVSNEPAQALYRKYGFHLDGRRRRYYSDNNEDAYIMTTTSIHESEYQQRLNALIDRLRDRLTADRETAIVAPALEHGREAQPAEESE